MHIGLIARSEPEWTLDLANALHGLGHDVTLYLRRHTVVFMTADPEHPLERLYELGLLPRACRVRLLEPPRMRNPRSFGFFWKLKKTIRRDRIDVAHILLGPNELWFALLASFLRKIPVVSTMIVPRRNVGDPVPIPVFWAIHKILASGSDLVLVNGADLVPVVARTYRISQDKIDWTPVLLGRTGTRWSPEKSPEEPGTVLFFGRADAHKGLEYLIRAQPLVSRRIPGARFLISAHGRDLPRFLGMIEDRSCYEIHEGGVPGDVAARLFQRASVVALPYVSASTSGVLLKAFAFGKPVVASRTGCLPEYVEDGVTGILVPPADEGKLAEAIVHLLSDEDLRRRMGETARRRLAEEERRGAMDHIRIYNKARALHEGRKKSRGKKSG